MVMPVTKVGKISRRLGVNSYDELLKGLKLKAKGMHRTTYERLVYTAREVEWQALLVSAKIESYLSNIRRFARYARHRGGGCLEH